MAADPGIIRHCVWRQDLPAHRCEHLKDPPCLGARLASTDQAAVRCELTAVSHGGWHGGWQVRLGLETRVSNLQAQLAASGGGTDASGRGRGGGGRVKELERQVCGRPTHTALTTTPSALDITLS